LNRRIVQIYESNTDKFDVAVQLLMDMMCDLQGDQLKAVQQAALYGMEHLH
jgi:hypothetical protein